MNRQKKLIVGLCILMWCSCLLEVSTGARILGIFPMPAKSHTIVYLALAKELARQGHEVVVVSAFPQKNPIPNYKDINIDFVMKGLAPVLEGNIFNENRTPINELITLWNIGNIVCDVALQSPDMQELISSGENFDAILMEVFFNECFYGFALKFGAPVITISSMGAFRWASESVANPEMLSYVPNFLLPLSDRMSFTERLANTAFTIFDKLGRALFYMPAQDRIARRYFGESMPPLDDLVSNTSLVLVNSHFSILFPRPNVPNLKEVGGMHIGSPQPLPQDLKSFCDGAQHGVIYFSFGSNLRSDQLPPSRIQTFLEAFSALQQRVLWKWESDELPGKPENVKVGKWLPQQDILAHPNVKLFITHGGLLSTQEAIYHGVPMLGMPFFGDQRLNMRRSVNAGFAEMLLSKTLTKDQLIATIQTMLEDKRYEENARRLSQLYRDQPRKPLEEAVFWTEYVIRHKGAPHMKSAALDLNWYQYFLLDVISVLVLIGGVLATVFVVLVRVVCRLFRRGANRGAASAQKKVKNASKKRR